MKLFTSITSALAVAAAVALTPSASAQIGTTTISSDLSVAMTVITNGSSFYKSGSSTWVYPTNYAKIGNKQLLKMFAGWTGTNWPSGAKLRVGWDWDGDVLVVDKTGTNVLFDATQGIQSSDFSGDYTNKTFGVDWIDEYGSVKGSYKDTSPGSEQWSALHEMDFWLENDAEAGYNYTEPYTYVWADSGGTQTFEQKWNSDIYTTWSDSEYFHFSDGDNELMNAFGSVKGTITADGSGKGENYYWLESNNSLD